MLTLCSQVTNCIACELDAGRVIYLIDDDAMQIYVLAIRRRPPYSYDDLGALAEQVE